MKLLLVLLGLVFLVNSQSDSMRRRLSLKVQKKTCGSKKWSMKGASKTVQALTGTILIFIVPMFLVWFSFLRTKQMKEKMEVESSTDADSKPDHGDNFVLRSIKYRANRVDVQWGNRWPLTAYVSRTTPAVGMFLADPASPLTRADHATLFAALFAGNISFYLFYYMEGKNVAGGLALLAVYNLVATYVLTKLLLSEQDLEQLDEDTRSELCPSGASCCVKMAGCINNTSRYWSFGSKDWCAKRVCGELTAVRSFFLFLAVGLYLAISITMFVVSSTGGFVHPVCFAVQESWGTIALGNFLVLGVLSAAVIYLILQRCQGEFDEESKLEDWKKQHKAGAHKAEQKIDSVEIEVVELEVDDRPESPVQSEEQGKQANQSSLAE